MNKPVYWLDMKRFGAFFFFFSMVVACEPGKVARSENDTAPITLVIHGGAGTIRRANMSPEQEKAYHIALKRSLETGFDVLARGGKSLDAVVAAIIILEDSPLFNAGRGAVFTREGTNEHDASLMDGSDLAAGAVAAVTTVKNPISAAYAVMKQSEHVMLSGRGADEFAKNQGLEIVSPEYFIDSARYQQFLRQRNADKTREGATLDAPEQKRKFGTVGAVALDQFGNIAAGTSTGGMSNKKFGRVGDSPIIGAGTYAKNHTCAVSATGWGEFFIRLAVAHDISAMIEYAGLDLQEACDSVILKKLPALGGDGGVIALDRNGNISMTFNTEGMYRGYIRAKGQAKTFLYRESSVVSRE